MSEVEKVKDTPVETEEAEKEVLQAEEKAAEAAPESKDGEGEAATLSETPSETPTGRDVLTETTSFKEESYNVGDLKDSEKKALQNLKVKIEEAIKTKTFFGPPKTEATREVVVKEKESETPKEGETKEKETETPKEGETEIKTEVAPETPAPAAEELAAKDEVPAVEEVPVPEEPAVVPKEEVASEPVAPPETSERAVEIPVEKITGETSERAVEIPVEKVTGEATGEVELVAETTIEVVTEETTPPPQEIFLWDVPLHSRGDERTDVILLKFLRARDFKVNDAYSMLQNTVSWRKGFCADSLVEEDFGSDFDSVAYMHGYDKEGHPVCYNCYAAFQDKELYQKTFGDESKFNKFLRWRIQVLEKGIRKLNFSPGGVHSMVQVIDLKDSPGFMKRRQITKKAFAVLQDNYPELVAKQIIINVPWYFPALYAMFGRLFTPRQESKVVVARPGKVTETLFKYIPPDQVPVKYGGLSRLEDTEFEGLEAPVTEVIVKAGEKHAIELPVAESGTTVVWDLTVVGWDVVYGEEFIPSAEGEYTVIIQKSKKVVPSEEPIRNSFKATQPGKIVLTVDNSASRKKKTAVYRYTSKKTIPVTDY